MAKSKNRRRKILIDKKFQFGISLKIIICLACYLILFCLMAVFSPFLVLLSANASEDAMVAASSEIVVFVEHLLLPLGLTFACLALHCILLSHKIAGPAYRFNRTFEAMQAGDLSIDVKLRGGDYLRDVEASYNEMIGAVRGDFAAMKDESEKLVAEGRSSLEKLSGDARQAVERVMEHGEALADLLAGYRVEPEKWSGEDTEEAGEEPFETLVEETAGAAKA